MKTVVSDSFDQHTCQHEFHRGKLVPCFEKPSRVPIILDAMQAQGIADLVTPVDHGEEPITSVHDEQYVRFLASVYDEWSEVHDDGSDAFPHAWCVRRMNQRPPGNIYGKLGYYSSDAGTPIGPGTWRAALGGAHAALTAAMLVQEGAHAAFALTRPPGHHAALDYYGGYCFLNNGGIAAQSLLDAGAERVAILDVDYHHGNGTQDLFQYRNDVLVISIHGDPAWSYPWFTGYREEQGVDEGAGWTINHPLQDGITWSEYEPVLSSALKEVENRNCQYLIVPLGVDTYIDDPISGFRLTTADFHEMGRVIARAGFPTLFVMEGGYAVEALGRNVSAVLSGFESVCVPLFRN